jgi:hypothetical protein
MIAPYPTRAEAVKRASGEFFAGRLFSGSAGRLARALLRLP